MKYFTSEKTYKKAVGAFAVLFVLCWQYEIACKFLKVLLLSDN